MTQITINIEDKSMVPHLKKILSAIEGVSIAKPSKTVRENGIERAMDDVKSGRGRNNVLIPTLVAGCPYLVSVVAPPTRRGAVGMRTIPRQRSAVPPSHVAYCCPSAYSAMLSPSAT